jgi:putative peptide zinc metalloprotease protein
MAMRQLELPEIDPTGAPPPALAAGTELIGEYEGSGYRDPTFLARRGDGLTVRMTPLLYEIARRVDGRRSYRQIVDELNRAHGGDLTTLDVWRLAGEHLQPAGLLAGPQARVLPRPAETLGLRWRLGVLPPRLTGFLAGCLTPFFRARMVVAVLVAAALLDAWLLGAHGLARPAADLLTHPGAMATAFGLVIAAGGLHELGHAAACRYGGARPGRIGAGLYLIWPAFFCDVTDTYRLGRGGRIRTDLGGVYFNLLFCLGLAIAYAWTGREFLLAVVLLQQIEALHQFFPFLRLDGYYMVADLIGVPDLFARIRPTLASFLPGRELDPRAGALRPVARRLVAAWVLLTVAVLGCSYLLLLASLPRIIPTAARTLLAVTLKLIEAVAAGHFLAAVLAAGELISVALPLAGFAYVLVLTVLRLLRALWNSAERPWPRVVLVVVSVAAGLVLGLNIVAHGRPIQPAEAGTIQSASPPSVATATSELVGPQSLPSTPQSPPLRAPSGGAATVSPTAVPSASSAPPGSSPSPGSSSTPSSSPSPTPSDTPSPSPSPSSAVPTASPSPSSSP